MSELYEAKKLISLKQEQEMEILENKLGEIRSGAEKTKDSTNRKTSEQEAPLLFKFPMIDEEMRIL